MTARASGTSEAAFMSSVVRLARDRGWGVPESAWRREQEEAEHYSRLSGDASILDGAASMSGLVFHPRFSVGSESGWPDLVLCRRRDGRVLFREVKTDRGRLTPRQAAVLELLAACGLDAGVWRPADMDRIAEELR